MKIALSLTIIATVIFSLSVSHSARANGETKEAELHGFFMPLEAGELKRSDLTADSQVQETRVEVSSNTPEAASPEETILRFDPRNFQVPDDGANLTRELLKQLKAGSTEFTVDQYKRGEIPLAPADHGDVAKLNELTSEEVEIFLEKKQGFLAALKSTLKRVRAPAHTGFSVISKVNGELYRSAKVIAQGDRNGMVIDLIVWGGLGLNKRLTNWINDKLGRFGRTDLTAASQNFVFSSVTSLNIVRWTENGEHKVQVELAQNLFRSNSVSTFAALGGFNVMIGYNWNVSDKNLNVILDRQVIQARVMGPLTVKSSDNHFAVMVSTPIGFTGPLPFVGDFMVYEGSGRRDSLFVFGREGMKKNKITRAYGNFVSGVKRLAGRKSPGRGALSCSSLFAVTR